MTAALELALMQHASAIEGMTRATPTIHDQFAVAALTGLVVHFGNRDRNHVIEAAWQIADDMMERRGKYR